MLRSALLIFLLALAAASAGAQAPDRALLQATEPPVVPVGTDAYVQWERWPYQRIGVRAYMHSTYDRRGGNEAADASHFLYQYADAEDAPAFAEASAGPPKLRRSEGGEKGPAERSVALDVEGPGVLTFVRTNHWHGSPWHYVVDGVDHAVRESSTADPDHPVAGSIFEPAGLFPPLLTWTWSTTKGADLMWVPIPFAKSMVLAYERTHYGTGYFIYHRFVRGIPLSRPLDGWDGSTPPDPAAAAVLARAGSDPAPELERAGGTMELSGETPVLPGKAALLWHGGPGPSMVRLLELAVPRENAPDLGAARLLIHWDGRALPSVDVPVALFFGAGTLYNRDGREYLVKGLPMSIRYAGETVRLTCGFPMPFFRSASVVLVGAEGRRPVPKIAWRLRTVPYRDPVNHVGYFHATFRDFPEPERGKDLVGLDTRGAEGEREWSGQFVGMSWTFSDRAVLGTLEGDPRFFFDDALTPQAYGTGTEEWGGGGDYWGGENMTLPLAGHPVGAKGPKEAKDDEDRIESAYRFLLADLMPFGRNAVIRLEHGGTNESTEHYRTVCYWYGLPSPSLVPTDVLEVGDAASEAAHAWVSPDASEPSTIVSRYEWGVDTLGDDEIYPAHAERERHTKGTSEFTLRLEPKNLGVLLRRTLDYAYPNQRAVVSVAAVDPDAPGKAAGEWKEAGAWFLAGSNTCVYSNPKGERGATEHHEQTSNRRFRDDEFLIPRDLTEGRRAIRVRVAFTPVEIPLFPGHPLPELSWSEIRYTAYSYVMPQMGPLGR